MDRLQEVFGGNAASDEYHIGRHVSNLFVTQTYEGQSDIHGELYCIKGEALLTSDNSADTWSCHHWHPSILLSEGMHDASVISYINPKNFTSISLFMAVSGSFIVAAAAAVIVHGQTMMLL